MKVLSTEIRVNVSLFTLLILGMMNIVLESLELMSSCLPNHAQITGLASMFLPSSLTAS